MEIWILLTAAGAGYLAQCWQSSQKSKESSIDITDDDEDRSTSSSCTLPSRSGYRSFSSLRRRIKGSCNQIWHESKFSKSVGKITGECVCDLCIPVSVDEESREAQSWHNCAIPDSCSCSSTPKQLETRLDAACSHSTYAISSSNIPTRCPALIPLIASWPRGHCGFDFYQENHNGDGLLPENTASTSLVEAFLYSGGCCMGPLYSAHCTEDSAMDEIGFMLQDGPPTKSVNDAFDNNMANREGRDGTWIPGFWDVFQDFSASRLNSSLIMQEHEVRGGSSTRKIRSHQSNERRRSSTERRRSLATSGKLTTSSDSCHSAQLVDDCCQEVAAGHIHNSLACEQPFRGLGEHLCNEVVKADASGNYLGVENGGLLLSPRKMSLGMLNTISKSESLTENKEMDGDLKRGFHFCCLPFQCNSSGQEKACRECPALLDGDNFYLQGSGNNPWKVLLFNFGVGVGMMSAIMSNKHVTKQFIRSLEEALCLLTDLEGEVQGRKKLRIEVYNTRDTREDVLVEQNHAVAEIVRRIIELVEQVRVFLCMDSASVSAMDCRHSKERARLEAELEAELERMEVNLSMGNVSEVCPRYSGVIEDDLEIGSLVQGELSTWGIPCDVEAHSDCTDSSHEVIHFGNSAVPPVELAKRLHEVLEARQDEKILELEAEVKLLDSRLQAKEEEFHVWKQRVLHLLQGSNFEELSSFQKKGVYVKAADTTKVLLSSKQGEENSSSVRTHRSTIVSPAALGCNEHFSSNDTKEASSFHPRGPQPRTCLGDEAYNEVCEEFFQLWTDTATESPSLFQNGHLKEGAHAIDLWNEGMMVSYPELEQVSDTNDATYDSLDTTPCLVKVMDRHTIAHHHLEDKLKHKVGMEASSRKNPSNLDWNSGLNLDSNGEILLHSDTVSVCQDKPVIYAQDVIDIFESHGQFALWSENNPYCSELDEQLGQFLIKRIVEKTKRGSSIVEVAQSVVASLDIDETSLETELLGG